MSIGPCSSPQWLSSVWCAIKQESHRPGFCVSLTRTQPLNKLTVSHKSRNIWFPINCVLVRGVFWGEKCHHSKVIYSHPERTLERYCRIPELLRVLCAVSVWRTLFCVCRLYSAAKCIIRCCSSSMNLEFNLYLAMVLEVFLSILLRQNCVQGLWERWSNLRS